MKKYIIFFIFLFVSVSITINVYNNPNSDIQMNEYIVVNNANGTFNHIFENDTKITFVLAEAPLVPLNDVNDLKQLETIDKVYPYYDLYILGEGSQIKYITGTEEMNVSFPLVGYYDLDNEPFYINEIRMNIVTNNGTFDYAHRKYRNDVIVKEFDSNSGIYISEFLYNQLDIDENQKELVLKVPITVPVICEYADSNFENLFNYTEYKTVVEEVVEVELEVQGVIGDGHGIVFCHDSSLVIPFDLAQKIYNSVDQSKYELKENQVYYEPNAYIVEFKEDVSPQEFAIDSYNTGLSIVFEKYDYGIGETGFQYWFDGSELRTWPNI